MELLFRQKTSNAQFVRRFARDTNSDRWGIDSVMRRTEIDRDKALIILLTILSNPHVIVEDLFIGFEAVQQLPKIESSSIGPHQFR